MKLRLLSFLGLVLCTLVSAQAQTTTNEVVFLNANKETIASNSTITVSTVEDSPFAVGQKQMSAELFISNTASDTRKVKLVYHIVEMEEGQLKVCTFGDCNSQNATGLYQLGPEEVENDEPIDLSVEHEFPANGKCKVILQIIVKEEAGDGTFVEKSGPQLTINFVPAATGIASLPQQTAGTYDVFNTQGVLLHKQLPSISNLAKGVYIVKYRGKQGTVSTRKYVVS